MKRLIYIFCILIGIITAIGTVGAADQELITLSRLLIQIMISMVLVGIGCFGLNLEEERDQNRRK